jgi:alanine-glyoxylate transaminase/(R)-3-amino-2-methylpropionate-pyruvate transaminase
MPACDFTPPPYDGVGAQEALELRKKYMSPALLNYYKKPILIHAGHMQYLYDDKNTRYLDLFGGICTVSVGHCHPKVNKAASDQMNKLGHITNIYVNPTMAEYAKKLTDRLPDGLDVAYFVNSGSEANDMAMTLARLHTGNWDLIALQNAYHGMSPTTMGLTNMSTWKYAMPHGFGIHHVTRPDPYRGPWGGAQCRSGGAQVAGRTCDCAVDGECAATQSYLKLLDDTLDYSTPGRVAGFFAEPIQGVGGTVEPTRGFLAGAAERVRAHGGVYISDEVQTGFGRLGTHEWGFEWAGVKPDIVTMAKSIGNGWPLAAVVTTKEIAASMASRLHFNTYGGNPVACAVGMATLEVMDETNSRENCRVMGDRLLAGMIRLRAKHDIVGDVRGQGLMLGMELVRSRETREPAKEETAQMFERCKDLGLLLGKGGYYGSVLRFKPPMCINEADCDFALDVLDQTLSELK